MWYFASFWQNFGNFTQWLLILCPTYTQFVTSQRRQDSYHCTTLYVLKLKRGEKSALQAHPNFCCIKRIALMFLSLGWDVDPLQDFPPPPSSISSGFSERSLVPIMPLSGERNFESKVPHDILIILLRIGH